MRKDQKQQFALSSMEKNIRPAKLYATLCQRKSSLIANEQVFFSNFLTFQKVLFLHESL